ncbi:hypothetical protein [Ferrovibrio sp.]|uniref:hypothetical protein n=1 Tax=Ferrovibrio sp. TaxID=1917215 RepID=UPI0025C338BD|nr:hypothetical protein [Ferrovibrio sp.]MBX3454356.1 hypothetical protein [Ferrovibrio sp.]
MPSRSPPVDNSQRSSLGRLGIIFAGVMALLGLAGYMGLEIVSEAEKPFYTPGKVPSRDDCFYEKIGRYKNLNKQILFQAAQECELEVQSIEGHEQARLEWLERKALAVPKPVEPAAQQPEPQQEPDRVRRVWR